MRVKRNGLRDLESDLIQVKDTTGAGDVFAAGFWAGLLRGPILPIAAGWDWPWPIEARRVFGRAAYPGVENLSRRLKN